jgi:RNA 3'-terminal phosphate cyclase (ATP)
MIEIDGSLGEGGGQILRSALSLSILTQQPFRIENIRAGRLKPGLRPQHLKAVDAAAAISQAELDGAAIGSSHLVFKPRKIKTGRYKFDIGTAGSTSLVLQTIFLPLSMASSASSVIISGGTHVAWAPCFHYLDLQWLHHMKLSGFDAKIGIEYAGFYPQGGGRIDAIIRPTREVKPLVLHERGELKAIQGISAVANLDSSIAKRQKVQALRRLQGRYPLAHIKTLRLPSHTKGTLLLLLAEFEAVPPNQPGRACFYSLGELGKPAERVADEAVDALDAFLAADGVVDQYLADQLLLPLTFANGPSRIHTSRITEHLLTNAHVITAFTKTSINIQGDSGSPGSVDIVP